jgi:hypothetical protein
MSVKSTKMWRFFLTAGLVAVMVQGLWQLPDFQDYFFPDNYWAVKVHAVNNEDWHIRNGLSSLQHRIDYLEWSLAHRQSPQGFSVDWMLHLPFSECIRAFSPKFAWNINIYLASKDQVKVQRKLKNLDALVNNIPLSNKQEFLRDHENILLNGNEFKNRFTAYNDELDTLKMKLDKLSKVSY